MPVTIQFTELVWLVWSLSPSISFTVLLTHDDCLSWKYRLERYDELLLAPAVLNFLLEIKHGFGSFSTQLTIYENGFSGQPNLFFTASSDLWTT